jgi:hypothetical protein
MFQAVLRRCRPWSVLLLLSAVARAEAPAPSEVTWGLRWSAPSQCIQAPAVVRAVEERLGRAVFGPSAELVIDGQLQRSGTGWRASLIVVDHFGAVRGTREVKSVDERCPAIDGALTLVIAVMIDPNAALSSGESLPRPPP